MSGREARDHGEEAFRADRFAHDAAPWWECQAIRDHAEHTGVGGPQFPTQFFSRDDIPCVSKKGNQDPEGLLLQLDLDAILAELASAQVAFEDSEADCAVGFSRLHMISGLSLGILSHGPRNVTRP